MTSRHIVAATLILGLMLPGYAGTSLAQTESPLNTLAKNDIVVGTAAGAIFGGLLGAGICKLKGGNVGKCAVMGAVSGAVAGFVVGAVAKERREEYSSEAEFLDSEIASADTALSTKEAQLVELEEDLVKVERDVAKLEKRYKDNKRGSRKIKKKKNQIDKTIEKNQEIAGQYQDSIDYLDQILDTPPSAESEAETQALLDQREQLAVKREDLQIQHARLLNIGNGYSDYAGRLQVLLDARSG